MVVLIFFVLGLLIGSFLNAAIYRLHMQARLKSKAKITKQKTKKLSTFDFQLSAHQNRYSILAGRSMCPNCKHQLSMSDLIPVISWLLLGGRCRYCKKSISVQYPFVELITAILFCWSFLVWDFAGAYTYIQFGIWLVLLTGLIFLAVYDLKWMLLPDRVLLPLIAVGGVGLILGIIFGVSLKDSLWQLTTAIVSGGFFYALFAFSNGKWMGGGDVKLAFLMGLILAPINAIVAFVLAFNIAAFVSIGLIIFKRLSRKDLIPFGPFLISATIISQLYGEQIFSWYLRLVSIY